MSHAVSRLRAELLAHSTKPFRARGGSRQPRCPGCRLILSHCLCALRPHVPTTAGVCLLMSEAEPLKPSNTGWLIADVVQETHAFTWARTSVDPALLALLADPQWQAYVVFPADYAAPERVVDSVQPDPRAQGKRPLFVLLDGTWSEARKMFGKSPYLSSLPVLSLLPERASRYRLRRSRRGDHFCTGEIAALCLDLAGEADAGQALAQWLDVYVYHYLQARNQRAVDWDSPAHQDLRGLRRRLQSAA